MDGVIACGGLGAVGGASGAVTGAAGAAGTTTSGPCTGNPVNEFVKTFGPNALVPIGPGMTWRTSKPLDRPVGVNRVVGPGKTRPTNTEETELPGVALVNETTFSRFVLPATMFVPNRFVLAKISFVVAPTTTTLFDVRKNPFVSELLKSRLVTGPMMMTLLDVRTKRLVKVGVIISTPRGEPCAASVTLAVRAAAHKNNCTVFMAALRPPCLPYKQTPKRLFSTGVCPPTK